MKLRSLLAMAAMASAFALSSHQLANAQGVVPVDTFTSVRCVDRFGVTYTGRGTGATQTEADVAACQAARAASGAAFPGLYPCYDCEVVCSNVCSPAPVQCATTATPCAPALPALAPSDGKSAPGSVSGPEEFCLRTTVYYKGKTYEGEGRSADYTIACKNACENAKSKTGLSPTSTEYQNLACGLCYTCPEVVAYPMGCKSPAQPCVRKPVASPLRIGLFRKQCR